MKFKSVEEYDGDYNLVKFVNPDHPEDGVLVGAAIEFGGEWKEPFSGKSYNNNLGVPMIAVGVVNLEELTEYLK